MIARGVGFAVMLAQTLRATGDGVTFSHTQKSNRAFVSTHDITTP